MESAQVNENDQVAARREKLRQLQELGINAYGDRFDTTHSPQTLLRDFKEGLSVKIAGRIVAQRDMGKSQFFNIANLQGHIQCFLSSKNAGEDSLTVYKLLDLGDWVGLEGETFLTKVGEPSVRINNLTVLSKALHPLPDKWHGLTERETKYRQRYLDLIANQQSREIFIKRSHIISSIRQFLIERDFLEVETPMLQDIPGGAAARPFETYHNALGMPLYLRIAIELYLKRLLVGGYTKVFELNRNFRNEGISRRHNPEFTMLEAYWAYSDCHQMADLVEEMICCLAEHYCGGLEIEHKDEEGTVIHTINLEGPWRRADYRSLIRDIDPQWFHYDIDKKRQRCQELGVEISPEMLEYEITQQVFEKLIEERTINPLFVSHLPKELVPLAKQNTEDDSVVDVYELIINGQEIAPIYSELNDPVVQRDRLGEQVGEETHKIDKDFLTALEYGMPPAGGIGIGIDRLVMMLTGAASIRDVVLFPQLKKKDA